MILAEACLPGHSARAGRTAGFGRGMETIYPVVVVVSCACGDGLLPGKGRKANACCAK